MVPTINCDPLLSKEKLIPFIGSCSPAVGNSHIKSPLNKNGQKDFNFSLFLKLSMGLDQILIHKSMFDLLAPLDLLSNPFEFLIS